MYMSSVPTLTTSSKAVVVVAKVLKLTRIFSF